MSAAHGVPARPDAPAGAVRRGRRWLPTWIVSGVMAVTVLGGFLTADALPAPEIAPIEVGGFLTVRPLEGWALVREEPVTLPLPTAGTIEGAFAQLSRGGGALDLLALHGAGGDPASYAAFYVEEVLRHQLERPTTSGLEPIVLPNGLQAVRFGYIGTEPEGGAAIEGSVTVTVGPSGGVAVFDGWGFEGQLELLEEELAVMIGSAEVA